MLELEIDMYSIAQIKSVMSARVVNHKDNTESPVLINKITGFLLKIFSSQFLQFISSIVFALAVKVQIQIIILNTARFIKPYRDSA